VAIDSPTRADHDQRNMLEPTEVAGAIVPTAALPVSLHELRIAMRRSSTACDTPSPPTPCIGARSIGARTTGRGSGSPTPIARPTTNGVWKAVISSVRYDPGELPGLPCPYFSP